MKLGTEQLANLLKNIKVSLHNKALGHYREMAWLPFQKIHRWQQNIFNENKKVTVEGEIQVQSSNPARANFGE